MLVSIGFISGDHSYDRSLGIFMTRVFNGEKTFSMQFLRPIEECRKYRLTVVDERHENALTEEASPWLPCSAACSIALLYLIGARKVLPFNPQIFRTVGLVWLFLVRKPHSQTNNELAA